MLLADAGPAFAGLNLGNHNETLLTPAAVAKPWDRHHVAHRLRPGPTSSQPPSASPATFVNDGTAVTPTTRRTQVTTAAAPEVVGTARSGHEHRHRHTCHHHQQRRATIAHRAAGRYGDAESPLLAAIETARTMSGDDDATAAVLRNDLAVTYKYAGRVARRRKRCTGTPSPCWVAALGADHVVVAAVWHNLGGIRHAQGDLDARRTIRTPRPDDQHRHARRRSPHRRRPTGQHWRRSSLTAGDDDEAESTAAPSPRRVHQPARRRPLRGCRRTP